MLKISDKIYLYGLVQALATCAINASKSKSDTYFNKMQRVEKTTHKSCEYGDTWLTGSKNQQQPC